MKVTLDLINVKYFIFFKFYFSQAPNVLTNLINQVLLFFI